MRDPVAGKTWHQVFYLMVGFRIKSANKISEWKSLLNSHKSHRHHRNRLLNSKTTSFRQVETSHKKKDVFVHEDSDFEREEQPFELSIEEGKQEIFESNKIVNLIKNETEDVKIEENTNTYSHDGIPMEISQKYDSCIKFEEIFSPIKYPGIDDSDFVLKNVEFSDQYVDYGLVPLHEELNPKLTTLLKSQLFLDKVSIEEEKISDDEFELEHTPECLKPIVANLINMLKASTPWIFKVNEETDNLVYNQDHFSFYSKYTSYDIINNDLETQFLWSKHLWNNSIKYSLIRF